MSESQNRERVKRQGRDIVYNFIWAIGQQGRYSSNNYSLLEGRLVPYAFQIKESSRILPLIIAQDTIYNIAEL